MGTRADFYAGRGEAAEWLGSIGYDGHPYPEHVGDAVLSAGTEEDYRAAVAARIGQHDDGTFPPMGWPWPWRDSRTTDYAYAWDAGEVWACRFGHRWYRPAFEAAPAREDDEEKQTVFPDMTGRRHIAWGPRSGLLVFRISNDPPP